MSDKGDRCTCCWSPSDDRNYGYQYAIVSGIAIPVPGAAVEKTVTPTQSKQVVSTRLGEYVRKVIIDPIPNNYGKITYDGVKLFIK